jgi:hypothetical protein
MMNWPPPGSEARVFARVCEAISLEIFHGIAEIIAEPS